MKLLLSIIIAIPLLVGAIIGQRHLIMFDLLGAGEPAPLVEGVDEGSSVRWHDDYFTIQALDERTFAIGEPRYEQQNYSYLIVGSERAVLFDAGPGFRDIRAVAESLTDRPITFVPSHFHYDHIGNTVTFERVAVVDLPYLRERVTNNALQLSWQEHLGAAEGVKTPTLKVHEWLEPDSVMSLGDRQLQVLYTPGHTEDSISLLDVDSGSLFSGDFIYPGSLYAFLPNSNLASYLRSAETVLSVAATNVRIFGAHRDKPPGAPELAVSDVNDLQALLRDIQAGEAQASGKYPLVYVVNERLQLLTEPRWLENWR
ncbi:MAG: MBL fold metallo-hydrolase [Pseudomonadales bacterium]